MSAERAMRVRIHRGAHEIGGSCVEVESAGSRLVLDVGRPLTAERAAVVPLPAVAGFERGDPSLAGVVITHSHQDHWGLAGQLAPAIPLFIGEATARILSEAAFWTTGLKVDAASYLSHRKTFRVGPFELTPFLNDHSAFDAYSLVVRAGRRTLFYTGDIRGHGRKSAILEELLRKPPNDVDVLLTEGTNIRADTSTSEAMATERDIEDECVATFRQTPGIAMVSYSAQNIDRLVTLYRAALRSGRDFVMDLYTASIARATANPNIPQPGADWPRVRVYVPQWQRVRVKHAKEFDRVRVVADRRIFEQELARTPSRFVLSFSMSGVQKLVSAGCLTGARLVYSLWPGYLNDASGARLQAFLSAHDISLVVHHTSGHASVADLQRLAKAMSPDRVVPIHTFAGHRYVDLLERVATHADGEWWDV